MAVTSPSFVLALLVLLYLLSLVFFAIVRVATGISIQRIGYFSLRRISYTIRDGARIDIRALALYLHRPTFARPTWVSLRVTDLKITIDVEALGKNGNVRTAPPGGNGQEDDSSKENAAPATPSGLRGPEGEPDASLSKIWGRLTAIKERIKAIHGKIDWLRMIDVEIVNSSCSIQTIATLQVASISAAVDTRRKTVDRGRLFRHKKTPAGEQQPAEWMFVLKGILFTAEGKESWEILDICTLNIHGYLYRTVSGLRDASISLKLGRIHIPYDDIYQCRTGIQHLLNTAAADRTFRESAVLESEDEKAYVKRNRQSEVARTVSEFRSFVSSILRGIQEIQLAISFIGLAKQVEGVRPFGKPLFLSFAMNEFGIDLFRLDPKGPAHRMYFASDDVAHQALLAAISIGVSVDDASGKPERLLYIPMATTTVKTTLPTKTIADTTRGEVADRNANILFANLVITSPSLDVDLKHMSLVLAVLHGHLDRRKKATQYHKSKYLTLSKLLPKANVKVSIQEPVARVILPPSETAAKGIDDYDLLISSISAVALEVDSSHTPTGDSNYSLNGNLRISSHRFYYQAAGGIRHNLLGMEAFEIRLNLMTNPRLSVTISSSLETLSVHMIRSEISEGLHQIVQQLFRNVSLEQNAVAEASLRKSLLRRCPSWLMQLSFRGSRFEMEVAGTDVGVSQDLRGAAVQLQSWSLDYTRQSCDPQARQQQTYRNKGRQAQPEAYSSYRNDAGPSAADHEPASDGRRATINALGLEMFVVEGPDVWEPDPILSLPNIQASLSTSSDSRGPVNNFSCHVQAVLIRYSLYGYYTACVAYKVLQRAFKLRDPTTLAKSERGDLSSTTGFHHSQQPSETVTLEIKVPMLQVKSVLPQETAAMLQFFGLEIGKHRWSSPFLKAKIVRLHAEVPGIKSAWARLVSMRNVKGDLRETRKKIGQKSLLDRSYDVTADLIRLAVPHQVVLHKILDSVVNAHKATEQIDHRFKTGTDRYVLNKEPQKAKVIPKISLRAKLFMFELEDSLFEWKLGLIYRVGLNEQKQRLARDGAFRVKVKKMQEQSQRRDSSRHKLQTDQKPRGRSKPSAEFSGGTAQHDGSRASPRSSDSRSRGRSRHMRYDADAISGLTGDARISVDEAWVRLQRHNAASWQRRIVSAMRFQRHSVQDTRSKFWGSDDVPEVDEDTETVLSSPERPGLMTMLISDLHILVDKPTFPIDECSSFLHQIGKGMPLQTKYSLLIPMSLVVSMGETTVTLRNYPLPLLHIPSTKPEQPSRLPSWSVKTDFVIAEEFRDEGSVRHVQVEVVPPGKISKLAERASRFCIDVRRTVSPVKTYSNLDVAINTTNSTSITWGTSYQPAIQDMMQVIESFTKPQSDPSERVGFWDKIRLVFHSRIQVSWKGGGDVHLRLKGSRDPYAVTGHGAGFVMCFRSNVQWSAHQDDDPTRFMIVDCDEYVLAIPDYSRQARQSLGEMQSKGAVIPTTLKHHHPAVFKKVIMKLSGRVRWIAGIVFEREDSSGGRSFDFAPHYEVALRTSHYVKSLNAKDYDAFRGFRSHHIHLSIAVMAPEDRVWTVTNSSTSSTYNSMHMSPRFFTHFFDWWSLFSGVMSLPIRQGRLFPGREKSSKKFGRHLATIKYNLLLAPLFISHIYKHKDVEEYASNVVGATGLKLRLESFMLDLHQRREEFASQGTGRLKVTKTSGMRINKAQLDFISADIRAVSASIKGIATEDLKRATDEDLAAYNDQSFVPPGISHSNISDEDLVWIDMDDFVELDWILPVETHPEIRIMPLAYAPRFTYLRQTDRGGASSPGNGRGSRFGDEPTHQCIMTADNDPQRVQQILIEERIAVLREQLESHGRLLSDREAEISGQSDNDTKVKEQCDILRQQHEMIEQRIWFMQTMLKRIWRHLEPTAFSGTSSSMEHASDSGNAYERPAETRADPQAIEPMDHASEFSNRFIIHNVQLKWNNSLRNIILRYVHQVSQRRGFVYYMSRRAVTFILDIVAEQQRNMHKHDAFSHQYDSTAQPSPATSLDDEKGDFDLQQRIEELLNDGKNFVAANDPKPSTDSKHHSNVSKGDLAEEFTSLSSYHVRLIAPQIQLQSEKNRKSVLLVTGREMQLRVVQIMDKSRLADDVSGLVQRRFSVDMDGVQFFVTNQKIINQVLHLHSANSYGSPKGSAWPPWAPVEVNFDFKLNPFGWLRVVQKTSASLQYEKYNTLRLKYNDEVNKGGHQAPGAAEAESRIDHLWVEFPHVRAICDSAQYYTMYVIVLDLLLYSEPLEKIRSERLEKIMLAADFSDLSGTPEMVTNLQERIRQLEEIKTHFQLHAVHLDRQGWQDRLAIERDLASCEDELFFIMKAITTSQRKYDERAPDSQSNGLLRWNLSASEIVWHLMRENNEPLVEVQLQHAAYERIDNSDGSNHNSMEIERIHGLNLLPDATYPEMIAPYLDVTVKDPGDHDIIKMFRVHWVMLEAIAGIPVLDQFEVNLFPLKVQLEREVGTKLFEYIFPGNGEHDGSSAFALRQTLSPPDDDDSDDGSHLTFLSSPKNELNHDSQGPTKAGPSEPRLRPTVTLASNPLPSADSATKGKQFSYQPSGADGSRAKLNNGANMLKAASASRPSASLPTLSSSRRRSGESLNSQEKFTPEASSANLSLSTVSERSRRFTLHRANSALEKERTKPSDELTEMMSRASNYRTLAYAKVPSVVLCLSYKGRGERNIEDVHNFVFRMPTLEYRNKTWSNLDLYLRVKRDIVKALISHTGAILGNKFQQHRPSKSQQSRLREAATSSSLLPNGRSLYGSAPRYSAAGSESFLGQDRPTAPSTSPFIAGWGSQIRRTSSSISSLDNMISPGDTTTFNATNRMSIPPPFNEAAAAQPLHWARETKGDTEDPTTGPASFLHRTGPPRGRSSNLNAEELEDEGHSKRLRSR